MELFNTVEWDQFTPDSHSGQRICEQCNNLSSSNLFEHRLDIPLLRSRARSCDLCALLYTTLSQAYAEVPHQVLLQQGGGIISLQDGPGLLSVYREPGSTILPNTQIGCPQLLEQASLDQFALVKKWISVCDSDHDKCRRKESDWRMPTRLLAVDEPVHIVESKSVEPSPYIALSHCWGKLNSQEHFCTYKRNIDQFKAKIEAKALPRSFYDALIATRGLGIKYIWIDSLCIIQDDDADWKAESTQMEHVFSAAYCTLAISSAKSSLEGFLHKRPVRACVRLKVKEGTIFVCPTIDDFRRDVELSELSGRGWVLQERALSRRTVYYTATQMYWECSGGVHCESLARLRNSKAAFLGDAHFPKSALEYYRDGRQVLIQDLYERYSGLAFTNLSDRSVAILGLQARLGRAFNTRTSFGFFQVYFARGILWQRNQTIGMIQHVQPAGSRVPTWSWLSKTGKIKYMPLKFEKIDWATGEFLNPLANNTMPGADRAGLAPKNETTTLRVLARRMRLKDSDLAGYIIFDLEYEYECSELLCAIIGRDKPNQSSEDPRVHVLVIERNKNSLEVDSYQRVGVGSLSSHLVENGLKWVNVV